MDPVVVTGTRTEARAFDLPMSIDSISRAAIQDGKARVNISEDLNRAPGTFVQNRENFAQELQIEIRGFGARSQFGTRGVKLFYDGLPASTPDGQGNPGIFDLGSAQRIEVLRGPFSALYGNHSGGVVQVFSESGATPPVIASDIEFGSYGFQRYSLKGLARHGRVQRHGERVVFQRGRLPRPQRGEQDSVQHQAGLRDQPRQSADAGRQLHSISRMRRIRSA